MRRLRLDVPLLAVALLGIALSVGLSREALAAGIRRALYPGEPATVSTLTATGAASFGGALRLSYSSSFGTPGNCTINKPMGCCAIGNGSNQVVVTNSLVLADAVPMLLPSQDPFDATCTVYGVSRPVSAGAFTVIANANCTDTTAICWVLFNPQ